mmetsp:Transcript_2491/g.6708  ORF Transcript_2491/g.6708 Transcript_2491/m.6708 type:complete len:313 (-) Transcript_2491:991-1929(-)
MRPSLLHHAEPFATASGWKCVEANCSTSGSPGSSAARAEACAAGVSPVLGHSAALVPSVARLAALGVLSAFGPSAARLAFLAALSALASCCFLARFIFSHDTPSGRLLPLELSLRGGVAAGALDSLRLAVFCEASDLEASSGAESPDDAAAPSPLDAVVELWLEVPAPAAEGEVLPPPKKSAFRSPLLGGSCVLFGGLPTLLEEEEDGDEEGGTISRSSWPSIQWNTLHFSLEPNMEVKDWQPEYPLGAGSSFLALPMISSVGMLYPRSRRTFKLSSLAFQNLSTEKKTMEYRSPWKESTSCARFPSKRAKP